MIKVSWSQSNSRACGGARPSGSITRSAEGALLFKCARILSISPVVRHSLFNAAVRRLDNDLDLPLTALAGLDGAATGSIANTRLSRCIFMPFGNRSSAGGARLASCPASSLRGADAAFVRCPASLASP